MRFVTAPTVAATLIAAVLLTSCKTTDTYSDAPKNVEPGKNSSAGRDIDRAKADGASSSLFGDLFKGQGAGSTASQGMLVNQWINLDQPPAERPPAVPALIFTYVLIGNVGGSDYSGSNAQINQARANLRAMLAEIRALPQRDPKKAAPGIPKDRRLNLFCIPSHKKSGALFEVLPYNFEMAEDYRQAVLDLVHDNKDLRMKLNGTGPFLVSTHKPISELLRASRAAVPGAQTADILVMDLSEAAEKSVPVFLTAFTQALALQEARGSQELTSVRAETVSFLLRLNSAIPFFVTASLSSPAFAGTGK